MGTYHIEQNKDLSEEIIHFIKTSPKDFDKFKLFLTNSKSEKFKVLLDSEEYLAVFFSYIFHYGNESDIKSFENSFFGIIFQKLILLF